MGPAGDPEVAGLGRARKESGIPGRFPLAIGPERWGWQGFAKIVRDKPPPAWTLTGTVLFVSYCLTCSQDRL
jgi:hypothetical protein